MKEKGMKLRNGQGGRDVRLGLVGCGGIGGGYVKVLEQIPEARITGVVDPDEARAKKFALRIGCDYFSNLVSLLKKDDIDAVVVGTPHYTHKQISVAALHSGKHVLCEKPMALLLEDCDEMIDAAQKADKKLMVGHCYRFHKSNNKIKVMIKQGLIGRILVVHANGFLGFNVPGSWHPPSWYLRRDYFGTLIAGGLIHQIDLIRWMAGEIKSVFARSDNFIHKEENDKQDYYLISIRFSNGAIGAMESGNVIRKAENIIKIDGEQGTITSRPLDGGRTKVSIVLHGHEEKDFIFDGEGAHGVGLESETMPSEALKFQMEHFIECIQTNKKPLVDGVQGRKAVEVVIAAEHSAEFNKVIELPLIP